MTMLRLMTNFTFVLNFVNFMTLRMIFCINDYFIFNNFFIWNYIINIIMWCFIWFSIFNRTFLMMSTMMFIFSLMANLVNFENYLMQFLIIHNVITNVSVIFFMGYEIITNEYHRLNIFLKSIIILMKLSTRLGFERIIFILSELFDKKITLFIILILIFILNN